MLTVRLSGSELKAFIKALNSADDTTLLHFIDDSAQNTITIDEVDNSINVRITCELDRFCD